MDGGGATGQLAHHPLDAALRDAQPGKTNATDRRRSSDRRRRRGPLRRRRVAGRGRRRRLEHLPVHRLELLGVTFDPVLGLESGAAGRRRSARRASASSARRRRRMRRGRRRRRARTAGRDRPVRPSPGGPRLPRPPPARRRAIASTTVRPKASLGVGASRIDAARRSAARSDRWPMKRIDPDALELVGQRAQLRLQRSLRRRRAAPNPVGRDRTRPRPAAPHRCPSRARAAARRAPRPDPGRRPRRSPPDAGVGMPGASTRTPGPAWSATNRLTASWASSRAAMAR